MVSHHVFYQLLLLGLLWLFLMLQVVWPSARPAQEQRTTQPITPPHKRSTEPKPLRGLTPKPHCDACAQGVASHREPPCAPPPPVVSTRGRRHHVATSHHGYPDPTCAYGGWLGLGNIRSNGHPHGGPWRQLYCSRCQGSLLATHGTVCHGKRVAVELIVRVIACLAEGVGIRGAARVCAVDPNTVLHWLGEAAEQLRAFSQYYLHDVHVTQGQWDELSALRSAVKNGERSAGAAGERVDRSPTWVWVAMAPERTWRLTIDVGERTLTMAQAVVHQVAQVLAPDCAPRFLTDGLRAYMTALLTHYGHWVQPPRRQATGPHPKPRWLPLPQLLYAQVVKTVRHRRLGQGQHRVVFGTLATVNAGLAPLGCQINTAFIERLNLTIRHHGAAVGRRVTTLCKGEEGWRQELALSHAYDNFVLPHASLRQPLPQPVPTTGTGSAKQWRPCTPALAAGLTDHVWTLREVLLCRVPPWPQPQAR